MPEHDDRNRHQRIEVTDDDHPVAAADVITPEGPGGTATASLRAEAGHITPGRRANLVDAVLDLPEVQQSEHLKAVFPLGDTESLLRLKERCEDVSTRPAGSSAILEAELPSGASAPAPESADEPPAG